MKRYYKNHNGNKLSIIPEIYNYSNNFIIMEYIEGIKFEELEINDYTKFKIANNMYFMMKNDVYINKFLHLDLHDGNWRVRYDEKDKIYKIIFYDFGYCEEISDDIKNFFLYVLIQDIEKYLYYFFKIHNSDFNLYKDSIKEKFDKMKNINPDDLEYLENVMNIICKWGNENKVTINSTVINVFIAQSLLLRHAFKIGLISLEKIKNPEDKCQLTYFINNDLSICKYYGINHEYKELLEKLILENKIKFGLFKNNNEEKNIVEI